MDCRHDKSLRATRSVESLCPNDPQYLQRDLGMGQAQCVEVLLAHEEQRGIVDCRQRRQIGSAVEDRQLGHRASWSVDAEHMSPPSGRTLKDTDVPGFDNVQAQTGFAFAENNLARCIPAAQRIVRGRSARCAPVRRRSGPLRASNRD